MFASRTGWKLEENAYTRALRKHRENGDVTFDLTASNPTTCGLEYDDPMILEALRGSEALVYDPQPKGLLLARTSVAEYYQEKSFGTFDPERLILTTSTSEAYSFLFRLLCEPGDEVLIAHPSYPLFEFLATLNDVKLVPFELIYDHGWQIDFYTLREKISPRTRAILLVHPNNPTGHFISSEEASQLNAVCRYHDLALVVDEVFLDYVLPSGLGTKQRHGSFAFNDGALTFVLSGLSKISCLPQMKVAWIAATGPEAALQKALPRLEVIADTYLSLNAPVQYALPVLLEQRHSMQSQLMERIEVNLRELDAQLLRQKLITRLEIEGGWYAVLRVPATLSDEELAIRLLEEQSVLVHPGHFYEFSSDGYLVVSLITPVEEFREGTKRILQWSAVNQRGLLIDLS